MKPASLIFFAIVMFSGCELPFGSGASALKPISSPDGRLIMTPSINHSNDDPTKYLCVEIDIRDKSDNLLHHIQTGASNTQKWALGWYDDTTIVIYSSDIGTYAWNLNENDTLSRMQPPLPAKVNDFGDQIKASKYGD